MENYQLAKLFDRSGNLSRRWYVEYKFKHPDTGQFEKFREWISSKKFPTRSARYIEATRIKKRINEALQSGFSPYEDPEKNYSFQQAFNQVLNVKAATISDRSNTDYRSHCRTFLTWLKDNNLYTLKPAYFDFKKCQLFADHLSVNMSLSNRTRNNYIATMRTMFEEFNTRNIVDVNHWAKVKKLRVRETAIGSFTPEERRAIAEILPPVHYRLYCVALIIYYCYLRPVEITRLQIKDFDFKRAQINVSGGKSKNGRTRPVVMHPHLVECLEKLEFETYPADHYAFATSKKLMPNTAKIAPTRIADAWREIMKKQHGITKNIYDLKATGAGEAFDVGIDPRQIQLQLRHSSLDETQVYLEKVRNKPGQIFREKMPAF